MSHQSLERNKVLTIRQYQPKDNKAVKALYNAGLDQFDADQRTDSYLSFITDLDDIEATYIKNNGEFLVGICDRKLVAMGALAKLTVTRGELKRMGVHPDYQGRGFAQQILTKLLKVAEQLGFRELCLDTTAQNIPSQTLVKKFGFIESQRKKVGRLEVVFFSKQI